MKHIYNPTAALIQRPTANATGTAAASKFFSLLLLSFFLLVSGESVGQVLTLPYTNDFNNSNGLSFVETLGDIGISGNELVAQGKNGNNGYNGYVVFTTGTINIAAGHTYTVSFNGKAYVNTQASNGYVELYAANSLQELNNSQGEKLGNGVLVQKTADYLTYTITYTATEAKSSKYLALRLYNQTNANNSNLYIDALRIDSRCEPPVPQVTDDSRCSAPAANIILKASGADLDNEEYRWYTLTNGIYSELEEKTGEFKINNIQNTGTYKYYVSRYNKLSRCYSEKVEVKAVIGAVLAPTVVSTQDCPQNKVTLIASGAQPGETYRWFDVDRNVDLTSFATTPNKSTLERQRSNQYGNIDVYIVKSGCESTARRIEVLKNNVPPTPPTALSRTICGSGRVTLTAEGATEDVETYRWYSQATGGVRITSGPSFTTNEISAGNTERYYVSKVNIALGCESSRVEVIASASQINGVTPGSIVGSANPEVGKTETYSYSISIDEQNIITRTWFLYFKGQDEPTQVQDGPITSFTIQSVSPDLEGVEVVLTLADGLCYNTALDGKIVINNLGITPLPVELMFFKAQAQTKGVNLTWATASELENKGFEVQVSSNGRDFKAIGFVESKVGTTSSRQEYSFLDTKAVSGTRYYRLKQIDFDGTTSFSPIRAVALDAGNGIASAYPNPFDDAVIVTLKGTEARNVQVVLMDAMGKVLQQRTEETSGNSITLDMRSVTTKGMYVLHVLDSNTRHTFKLMKR